MNISHARFDKPLRTVANLLHQAQSQDNPALWLYLNDLRTPLFRLQALARIYSQLHNHKRFEKLLVRVKALEDALGAVDYYAAIYKSFLPSKALSADMKIYFAQKTQENLTALQKLLSQAGWLDGTRIAKIDTKLQSAKWFDIKDQHKELKAIRQFLESEIQEIQDFANARKYKLTHMEDDVHELRRKLRWLSIYAQTLDGAVKLQEGKAPNNYIRQCLTPQTLQSPYNQLPSNAQIEQPIAMSQPHFMALSRMIAQLGDIKDQGLTLHSLQAAVQATLLVSDQQAHQQAMAMLGKAQATPNQLLTQASQACHAFFQAKVLDGLLCQAATDVKESKTTTSLAVRNS